mmetsp:Transcript_60168/g.188447  ORF Transcript_60168/g.188447 Transcript_60168/m.188447 type:complete len:707 (-) Transcript_60168:1366-3486(-)
MSAATCAQAVLRDEALVCPAEEGLHLLARGSLPEAPETGLVEAVDVRTTHRVVLLEVCGPGPRERQRGTPLTPLLHLGGHTLLVYRHPQLYAEASQRAAVADVAQGLLQGASNRGGAARLRGLVQEGLSRNGGEDPSRVGGPLNAKQRPQRLPAAQGPLQSLDDVRVGAWARLHVGGQPGPPAAARLESPAQAADEGQRRCPWLQGPPDPLLEVESRGVEDEVGAARLLHRLSAWLRLLKRPCLRRRCSRDTQEAGNAPPRGRHHSWLLSTRKLAQLIARPPRARLVQQRQARHHAKRALGQLVCDCHGQQNLDGVLHAVHCGQRLPAGKLLQERVRLAVPARLPESPGRVADAERDLHRRGGQSPPVLAGSGLCAVLKGLLGDGAVPLRPIAQLRREPAAAWAGVADRCASHVLAVVRLEVPACKVVNGPKSTLRALVRPAKVLPAQLCLQVLLRRRRDGRLHRGQECVRMQGDAHLIACEHVEVAAQHHGRVCLPQKHAGHCEAAGTGRVRVNQHQEVLHWHAALGGDHGRLGVQGRRQRRRVGQGGAHSSHVHRVWVHLRGCPALDVDRVAQRAQAHEQLVLSAASIQDCGRHTPLLQLLPRRVQRQVGLPLSACHGQQGVDSRAVVHQQRQLLISLERLGRHGAAAQNLDRAARDTCRKHDHQLPAQLLPHIIAKSSHACAEVLAQGLLHLQRDAAEVRLHL